MPDISVRELFGEEMVDVMHWLPAYALGSTPPLPDKNEKREALQKIKGARYFGLFEDGKAVSCLAGVSMTENLRGTIYKTLGIYDVASHPAGRRKGYIRQLMAAAFTAYRDSGYSVSTLYPFRENFYERLGYALFPWPKVARFSPNSLLPLLKRDLDGEVQLMPIDEGFDDFHAYLRLMQKRVHGWGLFEIPDRFVFIPSHPWLALAKVDGETVGLMTYSLRGDRPAEFNFRATRFFAHTSQGKYLLLSWIARHIDQANLVEMWLPPYEFPETWMPDLFVTPDKSFRGGMGRVLDVRSIEGMEVGQGSFAARIHDPICPWNEGVWRLNAQDGRLQVREAGHPDCELSIQGFSALIYGTNDPADFEYRDWGKPSIELQQVIRSMFPVKSPYLYENF